MILALSAMSTDVQGICFLVALVLFVIAAIIARPTFWASLVAAGLAFCALVWAWAAFAAAG